MSPLPPSPLKRPRLSSKSHSPPFSLHHQYPHRSVSGWSSSIMHRAQRPTFEQLPAAFSQQNVSRSQEDMSPYGHPSPQGVQSWAPVPSSEFDFYQTDVMLNQGYTHSPYSDVSSTYPELESPGYFDYSPSVTEPNVYNVFEVDFGSHASHGHPHHLHMQPTEHKFHVADPQPSLYSHPTYVPSSPSNSSISSSPTSLYFEAPDVQQVRPRDVSPASSASSAACRSHRSVSATDPKRRFPCLVPGCGRRFTSQYTLKVHTEAHRPKPRVSFPCTMGCQEKFSRQHDRLRHEVAKHNKVCEHSCKDCGRFFSNAKTFGNHKCPVAQNGTRWIMS